MTTQIDKLINLNIKTIKEYQKKLSTLIGVSGYEEDVINFIYNEIKANALADKAWIDKLGNVLAIINGKDNSSDRILFDAHIDEIGFMVSHIEDKGFLKIVLLGSWDTRILLGQSVIIKSIDGKHYNGIIGSKPPHLSTKKERDKKIQVSDLYIDIGMFSAEEVLDNNIQIGSTGTLMSPFEEFPNNMIRGKAFDDRTGCNVLLHIMKSLKETSSIEDTIMFNFAVQEEIGGRGAITGAFNLKPTLAIAIENTTAGDVPGIPSSKCPTYIGKGPAITIADKSIITSSYINKRLSANAELEKIPYQYKKPIYGRTDAGKIHLTREGVPSSVVSVPCRYIHSPTSLLKLEDISNTIKLLDSFLRNPANV
ncbi:MAG: M20/M25/M40 family metallo-hydrolase [Candidatus Lokiarchaeota archaeon]|nr:M20/M25/M40 family metallo-hydrolase [Candidatus Lokiarchaeota archaeon]MBD3201590.1 M20/M25/M40 family metallo-hydrolase [Candidatus Lokiarchaeota archaeon]